MIVLQGARERVDVVQFSPDGRTLVAPFSGGVQVWHDLPSCGPPAAVLGHRDIWSARFTPDGGKLLLGGSHQSLVIHDLTTGEARDVPLELLECSMSVYCDLSPDGLFFLAAQPDTARGRPGKLFRRAVAGPEVSVWSVDTARHVFAPPLFLPGGDRFVLFEWRQERVEAGTLVGTVYATRDARTGRILSEVEGGLDQFYLPVMSADRRLVAARRGFWAVVFRADDFGAGPVRVLRNDSRKEYTGLAIHPSGRYLAATSNDATVKLYDTSTWEVARAFDWDIGRLRSVAFSPDGMLAVAGGEKGKVVIWDVDL